MTSLSPFLHSALRIVAAAMFIMHGTQKLFGVPTNTPREAVAWFSQAGAAGGIELVGGILLLLGLFTRPAAFIAAGEMAYAYFVPHLPRSIWPVLNGGELAALYAMIWLYMFAAGPGPISVDAVLRRSRRASK